MKNASRCFLVVLGLLIGCIPMAIATTYYVSDEAGSDGNTGTTSWTNAFKTISNGLAKAISDDTVLVSNGTYTLTTALIMGQSKVTLKSVKGRDLTFINGNYPTTTNRCITVNGSQDVIDGFTITNGFAHTSIYGAGNVGGGGVYCGGSATIKNCAIALNQSHRSSYGFSGGGLFLVNSTAETCIVSNNIAVTGEGGGIGANLASSISNCTIIDNKITEASRNGGGIYGGNIYNCRIIGNSATLYGGGVSYDVIKGTMLNCLLTKNVADRGGGISAAALSNSACYISACTIVSNYASGAAAGGIYFPSTNSMVYDCVIWSNRYNGTSALYGNIWAPTANANWLYNCCVPITNWVICTDIVTNHPQFINFAAEDYHVPRGSPCLNAGLIQTWMTNAVDLDGNPRIDASGKVDIGCYERYVPAGSMFSMY